MTLHAHQHDMVRWMLQRDRCAVWCPMGGGKTLATLTALATIRLVSDDPILIIAPKRVARSTWPNECAKWHELGLVCSPVVGDAKQRLAGLCRPADIYSINIESLPWLIEHFGDAWPFRTVVVDESSKLKGFRTRQGTARAKAFGKIAHTKVDHLIELTGMPASNGLLDLWGQLWFIDRGDRLGLTYRAFTDRWFMSKWGGFGFTPLPYAQREIAERCRDVCLTVELPFTPEAPIVSDVFVDLPPEARERYIELERDMFTALSDEQDVTAVNAAALTMKCQQFATGAVYADDRKTWVEVHDVKLDALDSVIEEAAGMPVLVAYWFKPDLARLKARYPAGREFDDNPQTERDWNDGKIPVLFLHPQSAGHGLNLQHGGNIIVWLGLPNWSLELYQQAIERIGPLRQWQSGLNRPCFVYRILARGTIDEEHAERMEGKREVQEILMDAMKRREAQ